MTKFENDLLLKLLCMKEEEVKEKYEENGYEGFREIADHTRELRVEIMSSKRW